MRMLDGGLYAPLCKALTKAIGIHFGIPSPNQYKFIVNIQIHITYIQIPPALEPARHKPCGLFCVRNLQRRSAWTQS